MLNENVAFAKSILNKKGITIESEEYKDYLKIREICGNNNGYVGILTRIRFVDGVSDMDEIQSIYDVLKNSKIDISKLTKMSYNEILDTFYSDLVKDVDSEDIKLVYKDKEYSFYRVYTYKGIMDIGSPTWCLKTKSNWDAYMAKYDEQWVIIHNEYTKKIITPNDNYLKSYSTSQPWIRYGISLKHVGDEVSWVASDDNNAGCDFKPSNWTFYGVLSTLLNVIRGDMESYYDNFRGCEKVEGDVFHKVVDKSKFTDRMDLVDNFFGKDDVVYVVFSKSYSRIPICLVMNSSNLYLFYPNDRGKLEQYSDKSDSSIIGKVGHPVIEDYAKTSDSVAWTGIMLKFGLTTLDDVKKSKRFHSIIENWIVYDCGKNYCLVNMNIEDKLEISYRTLKSYTCGSVNPCWWFLNKENGEPFSFNGSKYPYVDKIRDILLPSPVKKMKNFFGFTKK